jgi:hypothetical protein
MAIRKFSCGGKHEAGVTSYLDGEYQWRPFRHHPRKGTSFDYSSDPISLQKVSTRLHSIHPILFTASRHTRAIQPFVSVHDPARPYFKIPRFRSAAVHRASTLPSCKIENSKAGRYPRLATRANCLRIQLRETILVSHRITIKRPATCMTAANQAEYGASMISTTTYDSVIRTYFGTTYLFSRSYSQRTSETKLESYTKGKARTFCQSDFRSLIILLGSSPFGICRRLEFVRERKKLLRQQSFKTLCTCYTRGSNCNRYKSTPIAYRR